jgi:hypothetical protein
LARGCAQLFEAPTDLAREALKLRADPLDVFAPEGPIPLAIGLYVEDSMAALVKNAAVQELIHAATGQTQAFG